MYANEECFVIFKKGHISFAVLMFFCVGFLFRVENRNLNINFRCWDDLCTLGKMGSDFIFTFQIHYNYDYNH